MKTCHKCNCRMWPTQTKTPTKENGAFSVRYDCANGHTGTVEGQAGTDESEWAHYGVVWGPDKRVDLGDGVGE